STNACGPNRPLTVPAAVETRTHRFQFEEVAYAETGETTRLHADRALGGDRHHLGPDGAPDAGGPEGARGGLPHLVRKQPQADRPGHAQLRERLPVHPAEPVARRGRHLDGPDHALPRTGQPAPAVGPELDLLSAELGGPADAGEDLL